MIEISEVRLCCNLFSRWFFSKSSVVVSVLIWALLSPNYLPAQNLPLDNYPSAIAAYSLRQLRSGYDGPALRVVRSADFQEADIWFLQDGKLDTSALLDFVGAGDGYVVRWYSQLEGTPDAVADAPHLPVIVSNGQIERDEDSYVAIRFETDVDGYGAAFRVAGTTSYSNQDVTAFIVLDYIGTNDNGIVVSLANQNTWSHFYGLRQGVKRVRIGSGESSSFGDKHGPLERAAWIFTSTPGVYRFYRNNILKHEYYHSGAVETPEGLTIGGESKQANPGAFGGYLSEFLLYPALNDLTRNQIYHSINTAWRIGPSQPNEGTLLPQDWQYQVDLYDWLETVTLNDVTLPTNTNLRWDGYYEDENQLARLYQSITEVEKPSRVTTALPNWYLLDDGNGQGIEATGDVRLMHTTGTGSSKSWGNELAYWYDLDIPLSTEGQGNPYYQQPALCVRSLVVTAVDMMMYDQTVETNATYRRNDMYGKALLSWAQAFDHCKHLVDSKTQNAFIEGFKRFVEYTLWYGAHDINTNMDMFFVHAAAEIYVLTNDTDLKTSTMMAAKKVLFGYEDGELGVKHDVLEGTFFPAGYIGEANGPETTYNGVSLYHLVGAYTRVHNEPDWQFLRELVSRMAAFKLYQYFEDPPFGPGPEQQAWFNGPSGYANRTGGSYIRDQRSPRYRDEAVAYFTAVGRPLIYAHHFGISSARTAATLSAEISRAVGRMISDGWGVQSTELAPVYNAWNPWVFDWPYTLPDGWFHQAQVLQDSGDASATLPFSRPGFYFNKAFGGAPTGNEFWAYKSADGNQDFGFFVEADAKQGGYNGFYGTKIEAFWTEATGLLILSTKDKSGCDLADRETGCWNADATYNVYNWPLHHVFGVNDVGRFSTAAIRSKSEEGLRTTNFNLDATEPYVESVNVFNDPELGTGHRDGEESADVLLGALRVTNRIQARTDGVTVTHIIESDQADSVREFYASVPVYLRWKGEDSAVKDQEDTSIEYWNGNAWQALSTSFVTTSKLRLGRDYQDGRGPRYGYVLLGQAAKVKLSPAVFEQVYQGENRIRSLLINLHGNPGVLKALPATYSFSYSIATSDGSGGEGLPAPGGLRIIVN